MKKILLIFIFIFTSTFASQDSLVIVDLFYPEGSDTNHILTSTPFSYYGSVSGKDEVEGLIKMTSYLTNSNEYYVGSGELTLVPETESDLNIDCIKYYRKRYMIRGHYMVFDENKKLTKYKERTALPAKYYNYCLKDENCYFNNDTGYVVCPNTDTPVKCPEGQEYNTTSEKCEDIPKCPSGSELDNLAIQKCVNSDFVDYEMCNPDTGEITITCKSCDEVMQYLSDYCESLDGVLKDNEYSCTQNADGSLSLSFSDIDNSMCEFPTDNETNNSDNNNNNTGSGSGGDSGSGSGTGDSSTGDGSGSGTGDNSGTGSNSDNNTGTGSGSYDNNSSSGSGSGTGSDDNNTDSSTDNSNNTCPDPCYLREHKPAGYQETSYYKNGILCRKITFPTYDNCFLEYHMDGLTCIQGCDNSSSDSNSSGNNVNVKVNIDLIGVENKLDTINNKLEDLKNLTPDSDFTVKGSNSLIDDFINQYKNFFDNVGSDINKLKDSFNNVNKLLNKDNYTLSSLNSNVVRCPLSNKIYGSTVSIDVCKFISPYKPLLQIIFTFFFNFYAILFFLKLVIYKEDK